MNKKGKILGYFLAYTTAVFAQEQTPEYAFQKDSLLMNTLEYYQEAFPEQNIDQAQFLEILDNYNQHHISINGRALGNLFLLNELQVEAIYSYRKKNGNILSWNEVHRIDGFTPEFTALIKPYLTLEVPSNINLKGAYFTPSPHVNFISRLKTSAPISKGYISENSNEVAPAKYRGSPIKLYNRLKLNYNKQIKAGFLMEKDAGEDRINDLTSAHLAFTLPGKNKFSLLLGDYHINLGQHLLVSTNGFSSRGVGLYSFYNGGKILSPNYSVNENSFLRGTALNWRSKNWEVLSFISSRKIDGSTKELPTPLQLSGLHRTESELLKANNTTARLLGTSVAKFKGNNSYRLNVLHYGFNNNKSTTKDTSETAYSLSVNQQLGRGLLFGELSGKASMPNTYNYILGILQTLSNTTSVGIQYRSISNKSSPYALPQSRSSIAPEKGLRFGFEYKPSKKWILNIWTDQFELDPGEFGDLKRSEYELISMLAYHPSKKHKHYTRFRIRSYDKHKTIEDRYLKVYDPIKLLQLRVHTDNIITGKISLRNRVELVSNAQLQGLKGVLCFTDIAMTFKQSKLIARMAYFNVSSYQYRIYAYEHDVLYSFKIPAFYGTGIRAYALYKHKISKHFKAETLLGYRLQQNANSLGSGNDMIDKNYRLDFSLQLIATF